MLRPLPGDPGSVRALAASCDVAAQRLGDLGWVLATLREGAVWDGPAGEAFGARVAQAPPVLDAVAHRFRGAVAPLQSLAAAMEEAQAVIGPAVREHDDAEHAYAVLEDRAFSLISLGRTEADPDVAHLRALQIQQAQAQASARARHRAASSRFDDADRGCAARLSALSQDSIADSLAYRFVTAASSIGHGVGALGVAALAAPELAPLALAGDVLAFGADASLLVVYGEGDLRALGVSTAFIAMGTAGKALRSGSSLGAEITVDGVRVTRALSPSERVVLGGAQTAQARLARVRKAFDVPPPRGTPSHLVGGPPVARVRNAPRTPAEVRAASARAAQRVREMARARADTALSDQFRLASANGRGPQAMYLGGVTLLGAEKVGRKVVESRREDPSTSTSQSTSQSTSPCTPLTARPAPC